MLDYLTRSNIFLFSWLGSLGIGIILILIDLTISVEDFTIIGIVGIFTMFGSLFPFGALYVNDWREN